MLYIIHPMADSQVVFRFNKPLYLMFSPQLLVPEKETTSVQYQPYKRTDNG